MEISQGTDSASRPQAYIQSGYFPRCVFAPTPLFSMKQIYSHTELLSLRHECEENSVKEFFASYISPCAFQEFDVGGNNAGPCSGHHSRVSVRYTQGTNSGYNNKTPRAAFNDPAVFYPNSHNTAARIERPTLKGDGPPMESFQLVKIPSSLGELPPGSRIIKVRPGIPVPVNAIPISIEEISSGQPEKPEQCPNTEQYTKPEHSKNQQYTKPEYTKNQQYTKPEYPKYQQYTKPQYTKNQEYTKPQYTKNQEYTKPEYPKNQEYTKSQSYHKHGQPGEKDWNRNKWDINYEAPSYDGVSYFTAGDTGQHMYGETRDQDYFAAANVYTSPGATLGTGTKLGSATRASSDTGASSEIKYHYARFFEPYMRKFSVKRGGDSDTGTEKSQVISKDVVSSAVLTPSSSYESESATEYSSDSSNIQIQITI
ncbi:hypothetical protein JCM33374_g391 [Metschnikowia sp. JCM 33374]|nr:hypothetical protein JCM33374_g391 [Metschnikowia sp. JCM 33374]